MTKTSIHKDFEFLLPADFGGAKIVEEAYSPSIGTTALLDAIVLPFEDRSDYSKVKSFDDVRTPEPGEYVGFNNKGQLGDPDVMGSIAQMIVAQPDDLSRKIVDDIASNLDSGVLRLTHSNEMIWSEITDFSEATRLFRPIANLIVAKHDAGIEVSDAEKSALERYAYIVTVRDGFEREASKPYRKTSKLSLDDMPSMDSVRKLLTPGHRERDARLHQVANAPVPNVLQATLESLEKSGSNFSSVVRLKLANVLRFLEGLEPSVGAPDFCEVDTLLGDELFGSGDSDIVRKMAMQVAGSQVRTESWGGNQTAFHRDWHPVLAGGAVSQR